MNRPRDAYPGSRTPGTRWAGLVVLSIAVTVIVMDGSIVNVALPTLARELDGVSNSGLQWIVDSYILSFAAILLTAGGAADRFGRRRMLFLGLFTFAATSVGAAGAENLSQLVTWRALMGFGAALIFPSTLAIVTETFPEPSLRRFAVACWAASSGFGVAIGPVAGGWLLERFSWGSVFLINLPLVALSLAGVAIFVAESRDAAPARLDLLGNLLAILGVLGLTWGLIEGPVRGWASPQVLGALTAAALLAAAFIWWESRSASPMLDPRLFLHHRFTAGCLGIAAAFFGLFGFVFMVTQYFQFVHGYGAFDAGLRTLPFAAFILLGSASAVRLLGPLGTRPVSCLGLGLMAAGFGWVTADTASTPYALLVAQMGFLGVGLGLINTAATGVIMDNAPRGKSGLASSVNDTTREIGGMLGVAVMGSGFNWVYRARIDDALPSLPVPPAAAEAIRSSLGMAEAAIERIAAMAGPQPAMLVRGQVADAFLAGFHASAWIASAGAAAGCLLVAHLMPARRSAGLPPASTVPAGHAGGGHNEPLAEDCVG